MRKACFLYLALLSAGMYAATGTVAYRVGGCDYFVVSTRNDYAVLEWFGGHDPDKGDVLVGKFESYGMKSIYDQTADEEITIWVEEYNISRTDALEKLAENCE